MLGILRLGDTHRCLTNGNSNRLEEASTNPRSLDFVLCCKQRSMLFRPLVGPPICDGPTRRPGNQQQQEAPHNEYPNQTR